MNTPPKSATPDVSNTKKWAAHYIEQGLSIVPWFVSDRDKAAGHGKRPLVKEWNTTGFDVASVHDGMQIGLKVGLKVKSGYENEGMYINCIDIDDPAIQDLADKMLPHTGLIGGKSSTPRCHRFYLTAEPLNSVTWAKGKSSKAGTILELFGASRIEGKCNRQIVVAPSKHYGSGDDVVWDTEEPMAVIDATTLREACEALMTEFCPDAICAKGNNSPAVRNSKGADRGMQAHEEMMAEMERKSAEPEQHSASRIAQLAMDAVVACEGLKHGDRQTGLNTFVFIAASNMEQAGADTRVFDEFETSLQRVGLGMRSPEVDTDIWDTTVERAIREGRANPRQKPSILKYALTEQGLVDMLYDRWVDTYRFQIGTKQWLRWTGMIWEPLHAPTLLRNMRDVFRLAAKDALVDIESKEARSAATKWYIRAESAAVAGHAELLLRAEFNKGSGLGVEMSEFDTKPWLYVCNNGVFDIRAGELKEPNRLDYLTKRGKAGVNYVKGLRSTIMDNHIDWVFGGRGAMFDYFWAWHGYCCTGDVSAQALNVVYGDGCNGKTSCLTVIREIMGSYAAIIQKEAVIATRNQSSNSDSVADMAGLRWGTFSESDDSDFFNEGRIKMVTGDAKVKAMRKYQSAFEFKATCKLSIDTNHKPRIKGTDEGIIRRVRMMPFTKKIPSDMRNIYWMDTIMDAPAEASGVLSALLDAAHSFAVHGLPEKPALMEAANQAFLEDNDTLGGFLEERADLLRDVEVKTPEITKNMTEPASCVYQAYAQWARENGHMVMTSATLRAKLDSHGVRHIKSKNVRRYDGILLKESHTDVGPVNARTGNSID